MAHLTDSPNLARLHLMPTCGTRYHRWDSDSWQTVCAEDLEPEVRAHISAVLTEGAHKLGLTGGQMWDGALDDGGSQMPTRH